MPLKPKEQVVRDFWEGVLGRGELDLVAVLMTERAVTHVGGRGIGERSAFLAWAEAFRAGVEGLRLEVDEILSADDRVVARFTVTGINRGFLESADNGRAVRLTAIAISAVNPVGRICEHWIERSALETLKAIR